MKSGGKSWRQRIFHEMIEYWVNFIYLAIFFAMFTWYRRLVLASYQISYLDWGISLIEAAVLAKIIMLRDVLCFGCGRLEEKPLIIPTLYKAVLFSVWAGVFTVLEHMIRGLRHGEGLLGGLDELVGKDWHILLAGCLVILFAFVPFFAFKELGRELGEGKIRELFFRKRRPWNHNHSLPKYKRD
jgi:hypothetical protein